MALELSLSFAELANAVVVNRLARWVGAGGSGMVDGFLRSKRIGRQKIKSRLGHQAAVQ
jgi:hypothetical protein